jgi:hypothetical protein
MPGAFWWSVMRCRELERVPLDRRRCGRVYAFYYLVVVPLFAAACAAGLALLLWRGSLSVPTLCLGAVAAFASAIAVVVFERRRMGLPRGH